jgi:chromosome segregation ATPase
MAFMQHTVSEVMEQNVVANARIEILDREVKDKDKTIEDKSSQYQKELNAKTAANDAERTTHENIIKSKDDDSKKATEQHAQSIQHRIEEINKSKELVHAHEVQISNLLADINVLKNKDQKWDVEAQKTAATIARLKKSVDESSRTKVAAQAECSKNQNLIAQQTATNQQLELEIKHMQGENQRLEATIENLQHENSGLADLQNENTQLTNKLNAIEQNAPTGPSETHAHVLRGMILSSLPCEEEMQDSITRDEIVERVLRSMCDINGENF